ncbi:hypothetical protein Pelo_6374 [Pelomyxa schiedti]|nr:hypothetical protein Pelo_6374 [Pelomyxa schiedti]
MLVSSTSHQKSMNFALLFLLRLYKRKPVDIDDAKHLSESPKDEKAVLRLESTCPITSNLKQKLAEDDPKVPVKKKVVIPAITVESEDPKSPQQQSPHQSTPRHPLTDSSVKRRDDRVVTNDLRKSVDQNPPPPQHPPVSRPQHHQPPHPSPHQHHPHDREHTAHPTQPTTQHEGRPEQDHQTPHPPQKHSRSGKFATSATSPKVEAPASPGQPQTPLKNSSSGHPKSPPGPSPSPKSPPVLSPAPKSPSPKLASPIMTPTTPNKSTNGTPHGVGLGVRANIGNRNTNRLLRGDGSRSGSRRMVPPKSGKAKVRSSAGSSAESHTDFSSEAHSSHHGGEGVGFGTTSRMCPPSSTPHSSSPFSSSHHSPVLSTPTLLGVGSYFTTTTTTTTTTTATTTTAANIDPTTTPVLGGGGYAEPTIHFCAAASGTTANSVAYRRGHEAPNFKVRDPFLVVYLGSISHNPDPGRFRSHANPAAASHFGDGAQLGGSNVGPSLAQARPETHVLSRGACCNCKKAAGQAQSSQRRAGSSQSQQ